MYLPPAFQQTDTEIIQRFIGEYSFATLVTEGPQGLFASHLPLMLDPSEGKHGTILGHMARANEQWQHFTDGKEILAIFTGPHAYISPNWYVSKVAVPTWNYAVIHAYGQPRLIQDSGRVAKV